MQIAKGKAKAEDSSYNNINNNNNNNNKLDKKLKKYDSDVEENLNDAEDVEE
jgi:hypothetical protein